MGSPAAAQSHQSFNFAAGVTYGQPIPFDWTHFEYLASTIQPSANVHVLFRGGRVDLSTIYRPEQMTQARGFNTLIVFNTASRVTLGASGDGRQLFASILAPFSRVEVEDGAGFVDGFIIARSFAMGRQGSAVQIHGRCFAQPLMCGGPQQASVTPSCTDTFTLRKCLRKLSKGKCRKRRIRLRCAATCGTCA